MEEGKRKCLRKPLKVEFRLLQIISSHENAPFNPYLTVRAMVKAEKARPTRISISLSIRIGF